MDTNKNGLSTADQELADKMVKEMEGGAFEESQEVKDALDKLPQDEQAAVVEEAMDETLGSDQ